MNASSPGPSPAPDTGPSSTPSSDSAPVLLSVQDGVATITLNRPEARNALSDELVDQLGAYLEQANGDDRVRAIVLTNTGNTFCAGADLSSSKPGVAGQPGQETRTFIDVFRLIMHGSKPVLGRIDGHAMGGGLGLVAACDISVMREDAKIGFTEVRLGVAPAMISVVCLPKLRRADASELFLTGERISPTRAVEVGLINRSCPAAELDSSIDSFVSMISQGGPNALAACKEIINRVPEMTQEDAFAWTAVRSRELFVSEEARSGIAAFRQRQPAPWVPEE